MTILTEKRRADAGRAHADARAALDAWRPADDVDGAAKASPLYAKYGTRRRRAERARDARPRGSSASSRPTQPTEEHKKAAKAAGGGADAIGDFLKSSTGRRLQREVVRGLFGLLSKSLK